MPPRSVLLAALVLSACAPKAPADRGQSGDRAEPKGTASVTSAPVAPDLLTAVRAKADDAPRVIGTCDAAQRERGVARFGLAHLNDLQARYSDVLDGRSRYAYIAGYLRQLKAAQPTIVLDAGDDYEKGALAELRSLGETTRQIVQSLPIDVRTIGNHDFAYGETAVLRDVRLSQHPVLAANVRHSGLPAEQQPFRSFARFDVGCAKVGIIGLVTQAFGADDVPTSAPYDDVFVQDDRYQAILEREAKAHRGEVDVLIALTHLGYAQDVALAHRGGRLVDFIVGAHTEDLLREPIAVAHHQDKTKTWVVQAGHYGLTFGQVDVVASLKERKVAIENYKIVDVDSALPPAEDVAELVKRAEAAVVPDVHAPIGRLDEPRTRGKPMAELLWHAVRATWGADVLMVGRDLFWAGLPKGDVTLQRLYDTVLVQRQPAGTSGFSSIWMQEVSGDELLALMRGFRGGLYDWFGVQKPDPKKRYRIALDKRAATYPKTLFGPQAKHVHASFAGEMIDALEAYARAKTAKGLALDAKE